MDLKAFYRSLSEPERRRFTDEAGVTKSYLEIHLLYGRKTPSLRTLDGLVRACRQTSPAVTHADVLAFFVHAAARRREQEARA